MAEAKQNSRTKKFIKDFGVYSIGVLGSKFSAFLLVPLYVYFIAPADYGYYDLCLHACMLLSPVITLQLKDGAFRHLLVAGEEDRKKIITFCYNSLFISTSLIALISLLMHILKPIPYLSLITLLLILMATFDVTQHIVRGLGDNKVFVKTNLICTFLVVLMSVIFVAIFKLGIKGIFYANILPRIIAIIYNECTQKTFSKYYNRSVDTKSIGRELIKYCLPLIPVTVCWWLTSSVNRFFVQEYLGLEMNGIYAVAMKLAGVLQTLGIIFYQTWQENAILQYNSKDRDSFFSKVFNSYVTILSYLLIVYIFTLKFCYPLLPKSYQGGLEYLYLMGMSTFLYTLTSFFDLGYQCAKETHRAVKSIFMTAAINVSLNFLLTRYYGIYGIIASSLSAYLFLLIFRYFDTRRYFTITIKSFTLIHFSLVIAGAIVYTKNIPLWGDICFIVVAVIILIKTVPVNRIKVVLSRVLKR